MGLLDTVRQTVISGILEHENAAVRRVGPPPRQVNQGLAPFRRQADPGRVGMLGNRIDQFDPIELPVVPDLEEPPFQGVDPQPSVVDRHSDRPGARVSTGPRNTK